MASVFWDAEDILFIDCLENGKTITREYYSTLLTRLDEKIREKRPGLQKKKIIFYQDSAPAHKSVLAMEKLRDVHSELLEHPPYSSDLAPSDFCLFPKLKTLPRWSAFFFESRGDCRCRGVFCRSYEEPLQGRDNGAGASLE
jgi:histone-lysine N-methyltransferase SETMAR